MLENVDLSVSLPKAEYRPRARALQRRLLRLQRAIWDARLSPVIVFEGWDAAGKGSTIRKLTSRLEPRGFELHATREPRTFERRMPWMWRYWVKVPRYGAMAIFDRSWYGRVLVQRVEAHFQPPSWIPVFHDINAFERLLAEDRYVVCKFFLHISKQEQARRFEALEEDPTTRWQVDPEDWEHHERYDEYLAATEEMLERTETEWGPWTIVGATDRYWTRVTVFETLVRTLEATLEAAGHEIEPAPAEEDAEVEQ